MPVVRITNRTPRPLNIALSIIVPIHFRNELLPQDTWETLVGSVWFRFECREDNGSNRYSVAQWAKSLGLFSLTGASIGMVAIPLAITGLAPIAGSSCTLLAGLAGKPLIAAAATREVLTLTTWIAANLTRKTILQIASEQGLKGAELEKTLQETSTLLDGIQYLCLPASTPVQNDEKPLAPTERFQDPSESKPGGKATSSLLGMLNPDILDKFIQLYSSKTIESGEDDRVSDLQEAKTDPVDEQKRKDLPESPLDNLTSLFHDFSKFHNQIKKRQKLKVFKKSLEPNSKQNKDKNSEDQNQTENEEEDWEIVDKEIGLKIDNEGSFTAGYDQYDSLYSNKSVYIGFENLYQFEWHMDPNYNPRQKRKPELVEITTHV